MVLMLLQLVREKVNKTTNDQLLFSSSFDKLYSDSNQYEGQTCVKLEAHQCPQCQKIKTYKIMDNPELPMSVNGVNLPGKE